LNLFSYPIFCGLFPQADIYHLFLINRDHLTHARV
jgi:hypothetical protein